MTSKPQPDSPRVARSNDSWLEWLRIGIPLLMLAILAFAITWHFVQPAPPHHVVIATGLKQGVYYATAQKYARYFSANGVSLEIRETGGSVDNFKLLDAPDGDVDIAIVQAGASPPAEERRHVQAVAGIYYEPVLLFLRGDGHETRLTQLVGKKIAIGAEGSGVRMLAQTLLNEAGVFDKAAGTALLDLGGDPAADALAAGQIDAALFVIAPDAPVVTRLLEAPGIHLMSFDQAHAYGRLHPFLSATTLYQGIVDIKRNLPAADVQLVGAPATLAIRDSTHPAIIQLLVRAAQQVNGGATLLSDPDTFPTADRSELPINKDARYFLKSTPNILHRTLPFWLASMVDRLIILVVPLLVVLVPLIRMMPPLFKWRVQGRIFRRYKRVRQIEEYLTPASPPAELQAGRDELVAMDKQLATLKIPISHAEELYNLRGHVTSVRNRLEGWLLGGKDESEGGRMKGDSAAIR